MDVGNLQNQTKSSTLLGLFRLAKNPNSCELTNNFFYQTNQQKVVKFYLTPWAFNKMSQKKLWIKILASGFLHMLHKNSINQSCHHISFWILLKQVDHESISKSSWFWSQLLSSFSANRWIVAANLNECPRLQCSWDIRAIFPSMLMVIEAFWLNSHHLMNNGYCGRTSAIIRMQSRLIRKLLMHPVTTHTHTWSLPIRAKHFLLSDEIFRVNRNWL